MTLIVVDIANKKAYTDSMTCKGDLAYKDIPKVFTYTKKDKLYVQGKLIKCVLLAGNILGGKVVIEKLAKDDLLQPFTLPPIGEGYIRLDINALIIDVEDNVYDVSVRYDERPNSPIDSFECLLVWHRDIISSGSGADVFDSLINVGFDLVKAMELTCTKYYVNCGLPIVEVDYGVNPITVKTLGVEE